MAEAQGLYEPGQEAPPFPAWHTVNWALPLKLNVQGKRPARALIPPDGLSDTPWSSATAAASHLIRFGISILRVVFFLSIFLLSVIFSFGSFLPFCCYLLVLFFIICSFYFLLGELNFLKG